ncbi:hypothetical protein O2W14_09835 [Modestobacter sp. VKM Ac-2986]|uniref:hypothetical protein n=1 Tax=Modestobacter sp. VKM Ac-2986 TaxID=3004140 RepID=UPI0022AAE02D|nr:hypothetical protein [Modestobacter sp. VKM Ac-2986]MCZ2829134.1 hypothetical protein [Modestobacter sp. VKM Ac-2986]
MADRRKSGPSAADRARAALDQALEALASLDAEVADRDSQLASARSGLSNLRQQIDSSIAGIGGSTGRKSVDRNTVYFILGIVATIVVATLQSLLT